jgi:spermidine synthase
MSFLSYIFPRELFRGSSLYSSDIRVIEDSGQRRLLVNGIEQSGRYINKILHRACDLCVFPSKLPKDSMLLLGIGGGAFIDIFRKIFPIKTIDAVDIDPVIIDVAKRYFHLDDVKGLNIVTADAESYVQKQQKYHRKYGLVVVDLYIGREIPGFVWSRAFITSIHSLVASGGLVFINVVHDGTSAKRAEKLEKIVNGLFQTTQVIPVEFNTFFVSTA